jgi:hypothetical protein
MTQNAGHSYQKEIYNALRRFDSLNEVDGIDVTFSIKNTKMYLEVKGDTSSAIDYGQAAIERSDITGNWEFKNQTEFTSILNNIGILDLVSRHWRGTEFYRKEEEIKLRQEIGTQNASPIAKAAARHSRKKSTPHVSYVISESGEARRKIAREPPEIIDVNILGLNDKLLLDSIRNYYNLKGINYIQIKNKGLFRISENDPLEEISSGSLKVPSFQPSQAGFTARLKNHKTGQYDYTVALKIPGSLSLGMGYAYVPKTIAGSTQKTQIAISLDNNQFINYLDELNQS